MRARTIAILIAVLIMLPALLMYSTEALMGRTSQESLDMASEGIRRAAIQCYALEGFYPSGLEYLSEHYGVLIDETRYFVDYQYIGSNLMPDITVLEIGSLG